MSIETEAIENNKTLVELIDQVKTSVQFIQEKGTIEVEFIEHIKTEMVIDDGI